TSNGCTPATATRCRATTSAARCPRTRPPCCSPSPAAARLATETQRHRDTEAQSGASSGLFVRPRLQEVSGSVSPCLCGQLHGEEEREQRLPADRLDERVDRRVRQPEAAEQLRGRGHGMIVAAGPQMTRVADPV